jgi:hypothetical protein
VSAIGSKEKFDDSGHKNEAAREEAIDRYAVARAFWIGAGVGAAAGVTLVLIAPKKRAPQNLSVTLTPRGASARLAF